LPGELLPAARAAAASFPLLVPPSYLARIRPGDPQDPLLLQVLPLGQELEPGAGYGPDPLDEAAAKGGRGLLHKYHGRVLLITTGACAVHCRYCFRRHFPYQQEQLGGRQGREALEYIAADSSVEEVILSGGDPLALPDEVLASLVGEIVAIPHVKRLRLHTRLPVVLPARVDRQLLAWLGAVPLPTVVVIHANHPQEIDGVVAAALGRLRASGALLLNQAVLLAGVNDRAATLAELSKRLFAAGVLPYYLNLLDRVAGAAHFEVALDTARALMAELAATLPGYLVPKLVREVPGSPAKVPQSFALAGSGPLEEGSRSG
ncbi:MAG TPA: EF-P beta-lysylation protein EpmB, partial [Thermoanaerobaculia bacterium]|nr:EF-P beta-lysylation protein EpmB [Thermoanaerobaculia bacterium]